MFKRLKKFLLTVLGDIKVFKFPMFIVYCPTTYLVKGDETRLAMHQLKPGDLILRGYNEYLDGFFIPGEYSHTGIYVGDGSVIHAIAEGVVVIDVIDFLRCDRFCIVRPKTGSEIAVKSARQLLGRPYDFDFKGDNEALYCHELAASVYSFLNIQKLPVSFMCVRLSTVEFRWLADTFLISPDFTIIHRF